MQTRINQKIVFFFIVFSTSLSGLSYSSYSDKLDLLENDSVYNSASKDFKTFTRGLYRVLSDTTLNYQSLEYAAIGYFNLLKRNRISRERFFTVIDFSKPSSQERLYIIDLCYNKIIYKSIVSHGKNSGGLYANKFSNDHNSYQSSLGFYITTSTYQSRKYRLAMRLEGLEYTNSKARSRGVVMHAADYATYEFLQKNGSLGRSYGCPAMPHENFNKVVDWLKLGTCLFVYYPDKYYLKRSKLLNHKDYLTYFI